MEKGLYKWGRLKGDESMNFTKIKLIKISWIILYKESS